MIKINNDVVKIEKFPDGTPRINIDSNNITEEHYDGCGFITITWLYENDAEMFYLLLVKKHLERFFTNVAYYLYISYVPNARMDRTKSNDEVFTLKYFCDFINWLRFSAVYVLDAHSDVSVALINNCINENPKTYIDNALTIIANNDIYSIFP